MQIYPKSKLGKYGFWIAVAGMLVMYVQYWTAMALNISIPPPLGLLAMAAMLAGGAMSIVALVRRDLALLLYLSSFIGLFGLAMLFGEILSFLLPSLGH